MSFLNVQPGTAMNTLFGNGLLGNAMTGLIRIPAFLAAVEAATRVGELGIRALTHTLGFIGFQPTKDNWVVKLADEWVKVDIRSHKNKDTMKIVQEIFILTILAVAATELVYFLGGPPPAIYNNILAFLGPVRVFDGSYLQGVQTSLRAFGLM